MSNATIHLFRHMPSIFYRRRAKDWFRKTYWVGCWHCDIELGPYPREFCHIVTADLDGGMGDRRPECDRGSQGAWDEARRGGIRS